MSYINPTVGSALYFALLIAIMGGIAYAMKEIRKGDK